jgi:putative Mg2+ transporter-C (MgtC) family protein
MISMPVASEVALRLVAATLIGSAIGLDRELRHKPAGLKTHALVALGSALVVIVAFGIPDTTAVSRAIQGIIAGVGFLGGGAILKSSDAMVRGLTTAASIWLAASLGIASGAGQWLAALIALAIALIVLVLGKAVEKRMFPGRLNATSGPPPPSGSGPERP